MTARTMAQLTQKVGFIGDGNMAKAICKGIKEKGLINYNQVYVSSPYVNNLNSWKELGVTVSTDNSYVAKEADVVILAVKPHVLGEAISKMEESPNIGSIKNKLFIAILAGITVSHIEKVLHKFEGSRVVRVMPSILLSIGEGCSAYCPGTNATEEDIKLVNTIFGATGICHEVPENMMDAIMAVSASGPTFAYIFIEALSDGGVRMGLHREMATRFAAKTVMGAAKMVLESDKHVGVLKDEVMSAGGTTIAGVHAMEKGGVRGAIMDAVQAAVLRAREIDEKSKKNA